MKWLEANGLSDSVPRMEAHYLNPSPWAEKERYEIEFNDIQREVNIQDNGIRISVYFLANIPTIVQQTSLLFSFLRTIRSQAKATEK